MSSIALVETLALVIVITLCTANPAKRGLRLIVDSAVVFTCLVGVVLNYLYVMSSPTDKTILPLFLIETSKGHGVIYPDFGQIFAILLLVHFIGRRLKEDRSIRAMKRLLASETPSQAEIEESRKGSEHGDRGTSERGPAKGFGTKDSEITEKHNVASQR